jgi:hypothetical protein
MMPAPSLQVYMNAKVKRNPLVASSCAQYLGYFVAGVCVCACVGMPCSILVCALLGPGFASRCVPGEPGNPGLPDNPN